MDAKTIAALQDRTEAKLRYAAVHLGELEALASRSGDDFDRAHQESFLFHLLGVLDAFLVEINCYYQCNLPEDGLSLGKLRTAIKEKRGETSPELRELYELEKLQGSWLNLVKSMRDHSTHVRGVARVFNLGGERHGEVWLKDPQSGQVIEQDFPVMFRKWHESTSTVIMRLRTQAAAQAK